MLNDSHRSVLNVFGAVLNGAGYLALAWTVSFLQGCAHARNPERARRWVATTAWVGAGLVGIDPSGTTVLRPALTLSAPLVSVRRVTEVNAGLHDKGPYPPAVVHISSP